MALYAATIALIFTLLLGWILVQQLARRFARRHPEFGPLREGGGCGSGGCGGGCASHSCAKKADRPALR